MQSTYDRTRAVSNGASDLASRPRSGQLSAMIASKLGSDAFELHYQDIRSLTTGRTVEREALLRWRGANASCPCDIQTLIEAAELTGQIVELGARIFEWACLDAIRWPDQCPIAVNVSPSQLLAGDFASMALGILSETGLAPDRLSIEITETIALVATPGVIGQLTELHNAGITLALDDFGTGYSSLENLKLLPFSKLKLDGCFIGDALDNDRSREIIFAIAALAGKLGICVVAEGIETRGQLQLAEAANCDQVQGYLFSRPRPQPQVLADIRSRDTVWTGKSGTPAGRP